jgi:hypothetical protein
VRHDGARRGRGQERSRRAAGPGWRVELPQRGYASAVLVIFSSCLVEAACLACALDHHVLRLPQPAYSLARKVDSRSLRSYGLRMSASAVGSSQQ